MSAECRLCQGRVCTDMEFGRLQNDNPPGKTDLTKIKVVGEKIEGCEMKQTLDWFQLEGKTDETHLGC